MTTGQQDQLSTPTRGYSKWFVIVTAVFVTSLITANITAVKLVSVFGLVLPAAIIIFPISYICGDVLTEVYGYRQARRVIWLGFAWAMSPACWPPHSWPTWWANSPTPSCWPR
jgi:uncharacterized PurR-regulated membrane protein YhhQ (DUF165 family)